jgi:hypothetical protein
MIAERAGFERAQAAPIATASSEYREVAPPTTSTIGAETALNKDGLDRSLDHRDEPPERAADLVEAALATALDRASAAGRYDVVIQLARELEARRLERRDPGS